MCRKRSLRHQSLTVLTTGRWSKNIRDFLGCFFPKCCLGHIMNMFSRKHLMVRLVCSWLVGIGFCPSIHEKICAKKKWIISTSNFRGIREKHVGKPNTYCTKEPPLPQETRDEVKAKNCQTLSSYHPKTLRNKALWPGIMKPTMIPFLHKAGYLT